MISSRPPCSLWQKYFLNLFYSLLSLVSFLGIFDIQGPKGNSCFFFQFYDSKMDDRLIDWNLET